MKQFVPTWQECFDAGMYATEAARARGVRLDTARKWALRRGKTWPDGRSVPHGNRASTCCPCEVRGKVFPSLRAAAKALQVKPNTISTHLAKHGHLDFVGTGSGGSRRWSMHRAKPVDVWGHHFPSKKALAAHIGVPVGTVIGWLNGSVKCGSDRLMAALMQADARKARQPATHEQVDTHTRRNVTHPERGVDGRRDAGKASLKAAAAATVAKAAAERDRHRATIWAMMDAKLPVAVICGRIGKSRNFVNRILSEPRP